MTIAKLIDPLALPHFEDVTPDAIAPALDAVLAGYNAVVETVVANTRVSFEDTWMPLERASDALDALWSTVAHLNAVANTPEFRAAYAKAQATLVEIRTTIKQDRRLFDVLVKLRETPDFKNRSGADRAALEKAIHSARMAGVGLERAERERFSAISIELAALSTQFQSAVMDAVDTWYEHIVDVALLDGIPESARALFAAAASAKGLEGWCVTLDPPSVNAVLMFATDHGLRERVYTAQCTRASDQGPNAGRFDNSERMTRILELRQEAATLLGFPDPVERSLATKMAADSGRVLEFLRDLGRKAKPHAQNDLGEVARFAEEVLGLEDLQPWDIGYVATRLRKERLDLDEEQIRAYFPVDRVLKGWKSLLVRLFGLRLQARSDVSLPHPDAHFYDIIDDTNEVIAGVYVDLHARAGKRGGAWMGEARSRLNDGNRQFNPIAYLNCNFAAPSADMPALLSHDDVITLLHETGHCLHLALTRVDRPSVAGTNAFEWDAIELPSQLMEDFAWDKEVLTQMSGHFQTGEPLPDDVFGRMVQARHFHSGMFIVRQLEFALFDILLHLGTPSSDPMEVLQCAREEVAVIRPPEWNRFPHAFGHIFAGGYAAGYYSYLWAEVLAADGFERFMEEGGVARSAGDAFREEVLARGASRPAAESFRAFRGRDADPTAMLKRRGMA